MLSSENNGIEPLFVWLRDCQNRFIIRSKFIQSAKWDVLALQRYKTIVIRLPENKERGNMPVLNARGGEA